MKSHKILRDLAKSSGDFMDLAEISLNLKYLARNAMYLSQFRFWEEDSRPNQWFRILEKKDPPPAAIVVWSIGSWPWSGRIYQVGRATSWVGQS